MSSVQRVSLRRADIERALLRSHGSVRLSPVLSRATLGNTDIFGRAMRDIRSAASADSKVMRSRPMCIQ